MSDYKVVAIKGFSCGVTTYRTMQEAREAAAIARLTSDATLIKDSRTGRTLWQAEGAFVYICSI